MRKSCLWKFRFIALFIPFFIASCSSTQKVKYFQDIPDSGIAKNEKPAPYVEPTIQVDDILTILVETVDPAATASINLGNVPVQGTSSLVGASGLSQLVTSGFLVNKDGYVEMAVLGKIKLVGSTTDQAKDLVLAEAVKYFKNPTVIVRYANFKVSVMGEVLKPGQYVVPSERVNVLDALAMAGDLTVFGKRENVLLIRENSDGTKSYCRMDLKKSNVMSSPFYYLKQNDIIYVEPRKAKSDATDASQAKYITLAGAILSIVLVLAYRVK